MEVVIGIGIAVVLLIVIVMIGYVKSPPDTAYMISGSVNPVF